MNIRLLFLVKMGFVALFLLVAEISHAQEASQKFFDLPKTSSVEPSKKTENELESEINHLNQYIGTYPPQFKNEDERQEIFQKWSALYLDLRNRLNSNDKDENLWAFFSDVLRQGHNLNVRTAGALADHSLKECFKINPGSVKCHTVASYFYLSVSPEFFPLAQKSLDFLRKHYSPTLNEEVEKAYIFYYLFVKDVAKIRKQIDYFVDKFPNSTQKNFVLAIKKAVDEGKVNLKFTLSAKEFHLWMTQIFKTKDVSKLESALLLLDEKKMFSSPKKMALLQSFLVTLFKKYPSTLDVLFKTVDQLNKEEIPYVLLSVKYANSPKGNKLLAKYLKKNKSKEVKEKWATISKDKMENPYVGQITPVGLDMLWSEFFVTGETKPLERILSALAIDGDGSDISAQAASWSLTSNAKNLPELLHLLKEIQKTKPSKQLEEIIQKSEK